MTDPPVTLAAIIGAHGIAGEARLKLFAESLDSLQRQRTFEVAGRTLTLVSIRPGAQPVARFAEITDRNAAEALRGALLTVARAALPPLDEGEYYHADLVGLACVSPDGDLLGTIVAVENFGAGDLLEIEKPDGRKAMLPFRPGIADMVGGKIVADPLFLA